MSMRNLSPTANLLRTSRLFALPPPLPRPSSGITASSNFESDTATLPRPIYAAIETTPSSLGRGDWGLKRPLPLKSTTRTSTPTINVEHVDSIDHITDFSSAGDHVLTLRKWQELGTPLSMPEKRSKKASVVRQEHYPTSVFESRYDNTFQDDSDPSRRRWKYKGPWLAGKTEGEFRRYVEKNVKMRRLEFKRFVRERLAEEKTIARRREATESGEDPEISDSVPVSEEDVDVYVRRLRTDEDKLHKLVEEYLDLPRKQGSPISYDKTGPPTTHPSAGLSYLRTGSCTYNHPLLGPQEEQAPIKARVIRPQTTTSNFRYDRALLGVGGVVAEDDRLAFVRDSTGITGFGPDVPGGAKIYIRVPTSASVDPQGRIGLSTTRPRDRTSENIALGYYHSDRPESPPTAIYAAQNRETPTLTRANSETPRESHGYGLENMISAKSSERASPFPADKLPDLNQLLRQGRSSSQNS